MKSQTNTSIGTGTATHETASEIPPHLLIVDDDLRLLSLLERFLADQGFLVSTASSAQEARDQMALISFDMLVVDVMMPGEDGVQLTGSIRQTSSVPVLMLTAMGEPHHRIRGLESGADDYLGKPFDPRELVLRIRGILRRFREPPAQLVSPQGDVVKMGACTFDLSRQTLFCDGQVQHLTSGELDLLNALVDRQGEAISREELAEISGTDPFSRAIDVQVTRLRKKIEGDSRTPRYLRTVRGKGYQLVTD